MKHTIKGLMQESDKEKQEAFEMKIVMLILTIKSVAKDMKVDPKLIAMICQDQLAIEQYENQKNA